MYKKSLVIFLHQNIWDQSSLDALEVEKFKEHSNVVAYELGRFINKHMVPAFKNKLNKNYVRKPNSFFKWKRDFLNLIKKYNLKDILIINKVKPTNIWALLILIELSKLKINIVEYQNSGFPNFSSKKLFIEKLKIIINIPYVIRSIQSRLLNFFYKFLRFHSYYYLISGNLSKHYEKKKIIYGSSWDITKTFYKFKKLKIDYKFAVYVESTIAHTGDSIFLGPNAAKIDKKVWFNDLNKFFNNFEKKNKLKVIIAAHPKAYHAKNSKTYKHRKVIKNKTKELISKAQFVFFERSTAINYIIKYKKPAAMIYNKETISTSYNKGIHMGFSKLTGIRNIDIENYFMSDLEKIFEVKEDMYSKYYKKFINFKNRKIPNYQILKNKFLKKAL